MALFQWALDRIKSLRFWPDECAEPQLIELQSIKEIDYLINDPMTPDLKKKAVVPTFPKTLPCVVAGWNGEQPNNPQKAQAANCHVTLANCANYVQNWMNWYNFPLKGWAATRRLAVVPRAGKMLNAYYDRNSLKFFYELNPADMQVIYTADSSDIVAHEMGHALLDALRPDFWSVQALEIWSFHESWADIVAMISIMEHDETLVRAIEETKGNLLQSNVISRLAEQVGNAIYHLVGADQGYTPNALRDASIPFEYTDPQKLPQEGPNDRLVAECHSFGRTFLSAWYRIMVEIYQYEVKNRQPIDALKMARDCVFQLLVGAAKESPRISQYYELVSKLMVRMARTHHPEYLPIVDSVLSKWRFFKPQITMLANLTVEDLIDRHGNEGFNEDLMIMSVEKSKTYRLADHVPKGFVSAMSVKGIDLAQLEIEVPTGKYYEFDLDGKLTGVLESTDHEIFDDACRCALTIQNQMNLGNDHRTMWEVQDNKLVRTFIE